MKEAKKKEIQKTIIVKVAKVGETVKEVMLESDSTVEDALEAAGYEPECEDVRCNGKKAKAENIVEDGDILTIVGKIEGGSL